MFVCDILQKKKKSIPKDGEVKKSSKKSVTIEQTAIGGGGGEDGDDENVPQKQRQSIEDIVEIPKEVEAKRSSISQNKPEEKSAMDVINEIFSPQLKEFDSSKPYEAPIAVAAGDINALQDLDERKLIELKEVIILIDQKIISFAKIIVVFFQGFSFI